jgi:hypothetical protein
MSRKLTLAEQWMKDHPDDTPCPPGSGGAARAWRLKRGLGGSAAWARTKAKRKAEHEKAPPLAAILMLVRYLEVDERKHFECMWRNGEDTSNHIFNSIKIVSDWNSNRGRARAATTGAAHRSIRRRGS